MITNLQDYILRSKLFKTFQLDDLLLVEYKCLVKDEQADIWAHHNYFAYVFGGRKKWKTQKGEYLVASGEALFVKKGANAVYQYFEEPFVVIFIFFSDKFIRRILEQHRIPGNGQLQPDRATDTVIPLTANKVLEAYFHSLLSYFQATDSLHPEILKLKVEELILNLLYRPEYTALQQYFRQLGQTPKVDIEAVMTTHFKYPLSLADYARLCARSLSTFRRDFKAVFKTTPAKWLIEERLTYGRFLLETTDKTINEIVDESGFKNRSHFLRLFKQTFGCTPSQFRKSPTPRN